MKIANAHAFEKIHSRVSRDFETSWYKEKMVIDLFAAVRWLLRVAPNVCRRRQGGGRVYSKLQLMIFPIYIKAGLGLGL